MVAASLQWCKMVSSTNILVHYIIKRSNMLAAPCLLVWTALIYSAAESGNGNMILMAAKLKLKGHPSPKTRTSTQRMLPFPNPLHSHWSLPLSRKHIVGSGVPRRSVPVLIPSLWPAPSMTAGTIQGNLHNHIHFTGRFFIFLCTLFSTVSSAAL